MPKVVAGYGKYVRNARNLYVLGKGAYNAGKSARAVYKTAKKFTKRVFGGRSAPGKRRFIKRGPFTTASSYGAKSSTHVRTKNRKKMLGKIMSQIAQHHKYLHITNDRAAGVANATCALQFFTFDSSQIRAMISSLNTSNALTKEILLQKAISIHSITNMTNLGNMIWIYDLVLRHDTGNNGTASRLDPIGDWKEGITDEAGGATDYALPYCTPYQSRTFCLRWKVLKVRKIPLAAGETHVHTTSCVPRMHLNRERVNPPASTALATPAADLGIGQFTSCVMVVALGNVAADSVVSSNVGFGPSSIDIVKTTRYEYDLFDDNHTVFNKSVTLGAITTAEFIQEEAGDVEVYEQV